MVVYLGVKQQLKRTAEQHMVHKRPHGLLTHCWPTVMTCTCSHMCCQWPQGGSKCHTAEPGSLTDSPLKHT